MLLKLIVSLTLFCAICCDAAVLYRGKDVLTNAKPIADIQRLSWTASPDAPEKDRIQGHMDINVESSVNSLMLVMQVFDKQGKLLSTFSISPKACDDHPCIYFVRKGSPQNLKTVNRFPFCGVENSHVDVSKGYKSYDTYKTGEKAMFYVDMPRNANAQDIRVVNVVIDGKEVQYNNRVIGNKLARSSVPPSALKHGTEAALGSEFSCRRWTPTDDTAAKPAPSTTTPSGRGASTQGQGAWGQQRPGQTQGGWGQTQGQSTWGQQRPGQTQGGTWGQTQGQGSWSQAQGQGTWGQQRPGQTQGGTWGQAQGQGTWGQAQGQGTWGQQRPGQGQGTWGQTQGQGSQSAGSQFAMPTPAKVNVTPGARAKLAAVAVGDIVVIQFMDGMCGRTVSGMTSPDDPESPARPSLTFEREEPGVGKVKRPIDLATGTKAAPQAVTSESAGELFMELRSTLMGNANYRVWVIPAKDSYQFYQSPVGKAVQKK